MNESKILSYKGYHGTVDYSLNDGVLYGKVIDVNSTITYEGTTLDELKNDFQGAIDDYLEMCKDHGETPEKPYSGSFNVRITPQLHHQLAIFAKKNNMSINASVNQAVKQLVQQPVR